MKVKLAFAAVMLAAATAPAFAADNVCLYRDHIDGWGSHGDHEVVVNDSFGRKYLLSLTGTCSNVQYSMGLGIRPLGRAGGVCVERGDRIVARDFGMMRGPSTCWISSIVRYTPEMERAYREQEAMRRHSG